MGWIVIVSSLIPGMALADDEPSMNELIERLGATATVEERTAPLPVSTTSPVNMDVQWRLWQRMVADGQPGINELRALRHDAVSLGIPSVPVHQAALLAAARDDSYGLDDQAREELLEMAHAYAPHLPYAKLEIARFRWASDQHSPHRAVAPFIDGVTLGVAWLDTRISWSLKAVMLLLISLAIAFVGFLLAQLLRYFGIAAYDGTRALPRGFSSTQTVILLMALILVPGLVLQSPVLAMLTLLLVVIPFQQINERFVSLLFLGFLAALPWVDATLGKYVVYPGSTAQKLAHAHYHGCDEDCLPWLEALSKDGGVAAYILASQRFYSADHEEMEALQSWLDGRETESDGLRASWANLRGAVGIARGQSADAMTYLEESIAVDPHQPAPWFNRMRAYQILGDVDASYDMLAHASRIDLQETNRRLQTARRDPASHLFLIPISADTIWQAYPPGVDGAPSLITPYWTALAGEKIDLEWMPWLSLFGLLLIFGTLPLYLRCRVSTPCPKCGLARDPTDAHETSHHRYCLPCYQTFVSGASLDYHARVHSEVTLSRRAQVQDILRRFLSLATPGVGHTLGGHAIRGTLVTLLLAMGLLILFVPIEVWRVPFELFREHWLGEELLAWALLAIGGLVGLYGLITGVEPTSARTIPRSSRKDS